MTTNFFTFLVLLPCALFADGHAVFDPDSGAVPTAEARAFQAALDACAGVTFPTWSISLFARENGGATDIAVHDDRPVAPGGAFLAIVSVDSATGAVLSGPEPTPEANAALGTNALRLVKERLHGLPLGGRLLVKVDKDGSTTVVALFRSPADAGSEDAPGAAFGLGGEPLALLPDNSPSVLSDEDAVRLAKAFIPTWPPAEGMPFLVDHVCGVTIVGTPQSSGALGHVHFTPVVWIHDATRAILSAIVGLD